MARSRSALALVVVMVLIGPLAAAQTPSATGAPPAKAKYVPPVKGVAEIGILAPNTQVDRSKNEVVTKIKVKNLSLGAIHLLRVDEYWYDDKGNLLPGDTQRWKKPFMPGEEIEFVLRVPKNPAFHRNSYKFTHANGQCKTKTLKKSDFQTK